MDLKRFVLAGIIGGAVLFAVSTAIGLLVQAVLPYNVLELGGMRAVEDPVMLLFFLHPWVIGFAMAILYSYVKVALRGTIWRRGALFGSLVWLVASIPSAFIVYTSMDYPLGFTANQFFGSLLYMIAAGVVVVRLME